MDHPDYIDSSEQIASVGNLSSIVIDFLDLGVFPFQWHLAALRSRIPILRNRPRHMPGAGVLTSSADSSTLGPICQVFGIREMI